MTTDLEAIEIKTNEFGEVLDELLDYGGKVYRKNMPHEIFNNERMNACVRNWRLAHGLLAELIVGLRKVEKILTKCGKEVNTNNLEAHQIHCPRCKESK